MKLEELKNWEKLTGDEQNRLKKVYGEEPSVTKTMGQKPPHSRKSKKGVK